MANCTIFKPQQGQELCRVELVILIGLQASGKSTFAQQHFAASHEYVSKDRLRNDRQPERRQTQLITIALQQGRSVVVDNTNPTIAARAALIGLGRTFGASIAGYYFPASLREALHRNRTRTGLARVPDVALYVTYRRLVPPSYAEGFDALHTARIGADGAFDVFHCRKEHSHQPTQR